jgi:dimethylhistidine N-methyltransferase
MGFKEEVDQGLSGVQKSLPSKYFYDARGDKLFQAIMKLPEYYLTRSEYEIFSTRAGEIHRSLNFSDRPFDLVEFGAGDGAKTRVFIEKLVESRAKFRYVPIDISADVLSGLKAEFEVAFPDLEIAPQPAEYFEALGNLSKESNKPKLVLFIGSSIGNFIEDKAIKFLQALHSKLNNGDKALIGFDLKKNPHTIIKAYNDPQGVTKSFNLNLLSRINQELDGDFDIEAFDHYPYYDPEPGLAKSYIVSLKQQQVQLAATGKTYTFDSGETIHTEISSKYTVSQIESILEKAGFSVKEHFFDCKHYYVDTLSAKS